MKIIFIASAASIHSVKWISYFARGKKNKITWISFVNPNNIISKEINNIQNNIDLLIVNNLFSLISTVKILRSSNNELVHIHYLGWHSLLTVLLASNKKVILTPWGSDVLNINKLKKLWLKYLFKKSNAVICDSQRLKLISSNLGAKNGQIFISMFGVDTKRFKSSRKIFQNRKRIIIGSNRNHEEIYNLETLFKAANILCKKRNDINFLIAGDGNLGKTFKNFVLKNKLTKNFKFLGSISQEEMLEFYNSIDIYISTSLSDGGLAASTAEAMSFQRIVLVTDNSDNKLWINIGKNGFMFKNKDTNQLVKSIEYIISNKDKMIDISTSARRTIVNNYSYEKEMEKVSNFYQIVLNKRF